MKPFKLELITGAITATLFAIVGFALIFTGYFGLTGMRWGYAIFMLLPFAAGLAVAMAARPKETVLAAVSICVVFTVLGLLFMKLEGLVCCLMALPLVLPGIFLGAIIGYFVRKYYDGKGTQTLGILFAAFLVVGSSYVESTMSPKQAHESVISSISIKALPSEIWEHIKAIEKMNAPKPFLLKIGLPVPLRCTLSQDAVGAKRICYFNSGKIEERVTEWDPPNRMKLDIIENSLPGRHWLGFMDAEYEIETQGDHSVIRRTTSYTSELKPRWYWRFFENMGFQAEHEYLLNEIKWRVDNIHRSNK